MRRFSVSVVVALFAAHLGGCAATPPKPAKPPPVDPETRLAPPPEKHAPQRILAPPPAYGNKIVMAEARRIERL